MVRDVALAASGLLSREDRRPERLPAAARRHLGQSRTAATKWTTSEGEDRYRRGLYTFIRRTSPYPSFMTFDAPSRELCTVRRVRTNTPLQALTTLNDEAFFEAARALAAASLRETPAQRRRTSRRASARLPALHVAHRRRSRSPRGAVLERHAALAATPAKLTKVGLAPQVPSRRRATLVAIRGRSGRDRCEQAAWTLVANALLNLDETLTKR